jgi:hypothetical protein
MSRRQVVFYDDKDCCMKSWFNTRGGYIIKTTYDAPRDIFVTTHMPFNRVPWPEQKTMNLCSEYTCPSANVQRQPFMTPRNLYGM